MPQFSALNAALEALPKPLSLPPVRELRLHNAVDALVKRVDKSLVDFLAHSIASSSRLYLLRDRLVPQKKEPPRSVPMHLRDYLKVIDPKNRKALARLVASDYPLAVERLRHGDSAFRNGIKRLVAPREHRFCRFCGSGVESPEHALLICPESEALVEARAEFLVHISALWPAFVPPLDDDEALPALKGLLGKKQVLGGLGAFTRRVFHIYEEIELQWPPEYVVRKPALSVVTTQ